MKKLDIKASSDNLNTVIGFIDELLEEHDCPVSVQMTVELCVEELFINIANYAYAPGTGNALIEADISGEPRTLTITFTDSGVPYDPLAKSDPDVTLSAAERQIGGLGIFLVKKNMDDIRYCYKDGKNILTVSKRIN